MQCYKVNNFTEVLIKHQVLGYFRYVGDIPVICDNNLSNISSVLKDFNISPKLMITLEQELSNRINFLDITVTSSSNSLEIGIHIGNKLLPTRLYGKIYGTHWNISKPV
jgi:hypothetical protein